MRSVDAFQAIDDMARMGMLPDMESAEEPRVYESISGLRPEDRVVPPGYVSLNAILEEARAMEEAEHQGTQSTEVHVLLEN